MMEKDLRSTFLEDEHENFEIDTKNRSIFVSEIPKANEEYDFTSANLERLANGIKMQKNLQPKLASRAQFMIF